MTFSIIAQDEATGAFGVATATGGPVVGSLVPHAAPKTGAIATQGHTTNPYYGIKGIALLAAGMPAAQVLEKMVAADPQSQLRQCIVLDPHGQTVAHSGAGLEGRFGTITARGYAIAGNLLPDLGVLDAMEQAFMEIRDEPLANRLLAALLAGQKAGGDRRGTRSAALKVYVDQAYPFVDVRVDWSNQPISELEQIFEATRTGEYAQFFARLPTHEPGEEHLTQDVDKAIE